MPPPSAFLILKARAINALLPTITEPTGHPRPCSRPGSECAIHIDFDTNGYTHIFYQEKQYKYEIGIETKIKYSNIRHTLPEYEYPNIY